MLAAELGSGCVKSWCRWTFVHKLPASQLTFPEMLATKPCRFSKAAHLTPKRQGLQMLVPTNAGLGKDSVLEFRAQVTANEDAWGVFLILLIFRLFRESFHCKVGSSGQHSTWAVGGMCWPIGFPEKKEKCTLPHYIALPVKSKSSQPLSRTESHIQMV